MVAALVLAAPVLVRPVGLGAIHLVSCTATTAVTAVSPSLGPTAGGTSVTIDGCAFTGATAVQFGGVAATGVVVNSDTSITATSPAQAASAVDVIVTAPGGTSAASSADQFTYWTACTAATLSIAPPSPSPTGTTLGLTAGASTCVNPSYEFWILPPGANAWQVGRDYSTVPTWGGPTVGFATGTYHFQVTVKDVDSSDVFDTNAYVSYDLVPASCTGITETASPASPSISGTPIAITGSGTGCPSPQYEFWMRAAGVPTWRIVRGYSPDPTYNWNSTGALTGTELFGVWVRDASSTASVDQFTSIAYSVTAPSCTGLSASAAPTSVPYGSGMHVTFTSAGTGCTNTPMYEYWMRAASQRSWQLIQKYSPSATYDWNTTGAARGTVYFGVWVRDSASSAAYDTFANTTETVT